MVAYRADGNLVLVDNKFLKMNNPLLVAISLFSLIGFCITVAMILHFSYGLITVISQFP